MAEYELKAEIRSDQGKAASRRLRRQAGCVPAILYGAGKETQSLSISHNDLHKACENEGFFSHIITIHTDGKAEEVILKDLQRHPAKDRIMHADFLRIQMDQEITVEVPLHFINEENCIGVRQGGGNISHNMTSLEITCLPGDLPEYIEVDVLDVELGSSIHISDLTLPDGLVIPSLNLGQDHDHVVVSVNAPKRVEESEELSDMSTGDDDSGSDVEAGEADDSDNE